MKRANSSSHPLKRWILRFFLIFIIILIIGLIFVSNYLYNYAFVTGNKDFISSEVTPKLKTAQTWLKSTPKETWYQESADKKLKLVAVFVPAIKKTNKTIVVFHGYLKNKEFMADYIKFFHQQGYNVLAPDARALGQSEGKVIGYGWLDHYDDLLWINQLIKKRGGKNAKIGLFGVSMGGATVMYLSGEKLPHQVKVLVEDCGYSSIKGELSYQLKQMFNLPSFPLLPIVNQETKIRGGYYFYDGGALAQLKKNKLPILFIHGSKDNFVPTKMVFDNYKATSAVKKLWVVKNAKHANSYDRYPKEYEQRINSFLQTYLP